MTLREIGTFFHQHLLESFRLAIQPSLLLDANIFYIPFVILIWAFWLWMFFMILGSTLEAVGNIIRSPRKGMVGLLKYYPVQLLLFLGFITFLTLIGTLIHMMLINIGFVDYSEGSDDVLYAIFSSFIAGFFIFRHFYLKFDLRKVFFPNSND